MNARNLVIAFLAAGLIGAGGYAAYRFGLSRGMQATAPATGAAVPSDSKDQKAASADKKVLYWHDPMVPGQKFDKPGKSPFMDMQLVPVYAGAEGDKGTVTISPRVQQSLGMRVAEVTTGVLAPALEAVGSVAYNERDVAVVQARANGYVERLLVRAPLDPVRRGQPLAELYVADWVAAQEEYLSVRRMAGTGLETLSDSARQRMRLAGMSEEQIRLVESTGKVHPRLTVIAPTGGVVTELTAREGMTVMSGAPLFRINGLATVWVNAEVPESQATLVRPGNAVEARAPALPEAVFKGRVNAILPEVSAATRTLKARVEIANPGNRLVPGMFATVNFTPAARKEVLLVPTEAVIQTGKRSVVMLAENGGKFVPVDVEIGIEANGRTEIRKGLQAGQKVVVSGQFLLDSEASLRSTAIRMSDAPDKGTTRGGEANHRGEGTITEVDPARGRVELDHGPIPGMKWPAMKMGFAVREKEALARLKKGDSVQFELGAKPNPEGDYVIEKIAPAGSRP